MFNNIVTLKFGLEVIIQTGTIRTLGCGFLFAFHSSYGYSLHHFRDKKARYWSQIVIFHTPMHSTPPLAGVGKLPSRLVWEN